MAYEQAMADLVRRLDAAQTAERRLSSELLTLRNHAEAMALALEIFELQGSDKTAALRLYQRFKAERPKETGEIA